MSPRDNLHRLIDDLPESEIPRVARVLETLREAAEEPLFTLDNAPESDEPETAEEAAAVAEAWREHREGKGATTEELKTEVIRKKRLEDALVHRGQIDLQLSQERLQKLRANR